jgi:hypothetical protein
MSPPTRTCRKLRIPKLRQGSYFPPFLEPPEPTSTKLESADSGESPACAYLAVQLHRLAVAGTRAGVGRAGTTAQILERQHRDRWLVGERQLWREGIFRQLSRSVPRLCDAKTGPTG